jgi:hypothetical protein
MNHRQFVPPLNQGKLERLQTRLDDVVGPAYSSRLPTLPKMMTGGGSSPNCGRVTFVLHFSPSFQAAYKHSFPACSTGDPSRVAKDSSQTAGCVSVVVAKGIALDEYA